MSLREHSTILGVQAWPGATRRVAWHALGVLLAAVVAWLILAAYRQPDFILDLAALRLC